MSSPARTSRLAPGALAIALVAAAALAAATFTARDTRADVQPEQYSMEVIVTETSVPVGNAFVAQLWIQHNFFAQPGECDLAFVTGCYAAAQWNLDFDQTLVSAGANCTGAAACTTITRQSGAPTQCNQENNNGDRVLTGCIDLSGDVIGYSGRVFNVTFTCNAPGTATFTLTTATQPTFVATFDGTEQPIHTHGDSVVCEGAAPNTSTPTSTATVQAPTHTPTSTPTPTATSQAPTHTPTHTATATQTSVGPTHTPTHTATATQTSVGATHTPTNTPTGEPTTPPTSTPTRTPTLTATPTTLAGECPEDVNGDGEVNGQDVAFVARNLRRQDPAADVNGDGKVTVADLHQVIAAMKAGC